MKKKKKNVVGVFKIAPNFTKDVGVVSIDTPNTGALTSAETVKVTLYNFGEASQTNFPVNLKVNGNNVATETFTGALAASGTAEFTFATKANLGTEGAVYALQASTQLSGDEDNSNNTITKSVTHSFQKDTGVTEITAPNSGSYLGSQSIVVKVSNFGTSAVSNLPVSYQVNSGTPIVENITATIAPGATVNYTFTTPYNFALVQNYTIVAKTNLVGDGIPTNDAATKTISNSACATLSNNTQYPIGPNMNTVTQSVISNPQSFILSDVNVKVNLTHSYVADIDMKLIAPDGTEVILAQDLGGSGDNYTNTVFDDAAAVSITTGTAPFTGTYRPQQPLSVLNGKQALGNWTLHITDDANTDGGNLLNWSVELCSNAPVLSTNNSELNNANFLVYEVTKGKFKASLKDTKMYRNADLQVYDMAGQMVLVKRMAKSADNFETEFDLSMAPKGAYIIKVSDGMQNFTKKILVK